MDAIQQLRKLQDGLTERGLRSQISTDPRWCVPELVPTLNCCPYLGCAQVTITEDGRYQWLNGDGDYVTHAPDPMDATIEALIRTRAGTATLPTAHPGPLSPSSPRSGPHGVGGLR